MMNILPRNPADHVIYRHVIKISDISVCVPVDDSSNGTTFLTIVVYDKQKTAIVDDPSDMINTRSPGRRQSTRVIRSLGSSTRVVIKFTGVETKSSKITALFSHF
jgi:hypothetical protein